MFVDEFVEVARRLGSQANRPLPFTPSFIPLATSARPVPCVAVDGSHAVLVDNGALWVIAYRAAAVPWPNPPRAEVQPEVLAATPDEGQAHVAKLCARHGIEPPRINSAESFAQAAREIAEHEATLQAIAKMPQDSLLLIDGAIRGLPPGPQALADRVLAAAGRHGLRVLAVSKRSGLTSGDVPIVPALAELGPKNAWSVALPGYDGVFVARLHAKSQAVFRVDAQKQEDLNLLLPLSRDAVYTGYPYPLALAHNAVALTAGKVAELKARLDRAVRVTGGKAAGALSDFHAVLDRNVPA